jgi:hypothetical protein
VRKKTATENNEHSKAKSLPHLQIGHSSDAPKGGDWFATHGKTKFDSMVAATTITTADVFL